jgi:hypothetical protein
MEEMWKKKEASGRRVGEGSTTVLLVMRSKIRKCLRGREKRKREREGGEGGRTISVRAGLVGI